MRAIIIDPQTQTVSEVEHNGDYTEIYKFIGNDCHTFEAPIVLDNGDTLYCDENGLSHENIGGIFKSDWRFPLVGRILILNLDYETGDSQSAKSSLEAIKNEFPILGATNYMMINWFAQNS